MVTFDQLVSAWRALDLDAGSPVIAHASLSAFGEVQGGPESVVGALLAVYDSLVMPSFTYKTMVVPEQGPPENGIQYGGSKDLNLMAEFFRPDMPADRLMGIVPETLRRHPLAKRSRHPILSFTGVNVDEILAAQTIEEPLGPIRALMEAEGWVLLLGVNQMVNTSIHLGEKLAGRKQFVRWALTPHGVQECPAFPGCSDGFEALAGALYGLTRRVQVGPALVQAAPLPELVQMVQERVEADPLALLCTRSYCERCLAVRENVAASRGYAGG